MRMECLADKTKNRFEIKKQQQQQQKIPCEPEIKSLRLLGVNSRTLKLLNSIKIFDSCLMPNVINSYRDY